MTKGGGGLESIREGSEDRNDDQIELRLENIGKQATEAKVSEIRGQEDKKGREADERGNLLAKDLTTEETRRAVKQTKRGKAVGEDWRMGFQMSFWRKGGGGGGGGGGSCGENRIPI